MGPIVKEKTHRETRICLESSVSIMTNAASSHGISP